MRPYTHFTGCERLFLSYVFTSISLLLSSIPLLQIFLPQPFHMHYRPLWAKPIQYNMHQYVQNWELECIRIITFDNFFYNILKSWWVCFRTLLKLYFAAVLIPIRSIKLSNDKNWYNYFFSRFTFQGGGGRIWNPGFLRNSHQLITPPPSLGSAGGNVTYCTSNN